VQTRDDSVDVRYSRRNAVIDLRQHPLQVIAYFPE
jgi:hypothetical protein